MKDVKLNDEGLSVLAADDADEADVKARLTPEPVEAPETDTVEVADGLSVNVGPDEDPEEVKARYASTKLVEPANKATKATTAKKS